jgi:ABC-type phosphate transport system substrate-binding protein
MLKRILLGVGALVGTLLAMPAVGDSTGPIAVIVNNNSPINDLSMKELKAAFQGYGLPNLKTQNIALAYVRGEIEDSFNRRVLGVSSKKVKVYWLRRVFQGESDLRRICATVAEVKKFVGQNEASIGFIPASELDDSVRAISIDDEKHDAPGYPLR